MNIPLKIVFIFWLVGAATAQVPLEGSGTDDTTTPEAPEGSGDITDSPAQGHCASNSCIGDSICEERVEDFVCVCWPGLVYNNVSGCVQAKVFPGSLTLKGTFDKLMADKTSEVFKATAARIEKQLRGVLKDYGNGYLNSIVLSLRSGSIVAEVQNIYDFTSTVTAKQIQTNIMKAVNDSKIQNATEFKEKSLCDVESCDSTTTTCKEEVSGVADCTCKEGYITILSTSRVCIACPNGQREVDKEKCEKCPFGFAGFNCNDPYLLVLVVVSTVLGAFLIIFIVALVVVSCRKQNETSSPKVDFSSSYGNMELHKPTGVPRIPRANPDASWKSNNLEMTNSGSNQELVTRDRPESKARYSDYEEDVSYRGQVPPAYSGYDGRGVGNGGVQNPYFRQDDDRMRRY